MRRTELSCTAAGWRLGRRGGAWDGSMGEHLSALDRVHELTVTGVGEPREPLLLDGTGATEAANFLHRAMARGTLVCGDLPAAVRAHLPADIAATIEPAGGSSSAGSPVAGDLAWDCRAVAQRRTVLRHADPRLPPVSLVLVSRRPDLVLPMVERLSRLDYPSLEIVVGMHGPKPPPGLEEAAGGRPIVVRRYKRKQVFGEVLNDAFSLTSGSLVGKIDDDDYYGDSYLRDLVTALDYSRATLVGMTTTVVHLQAIDTTVRRVFGQPESFTHRVAGGTFLLSKADLDEVGGWRAVPRAVDTALIEDVLTAGGTIYRPHDIGYLYERSVDPISHTWAADVEHFLRNTREQWVGLLRHHEFGTAS